MSAASSGACTKLRHCLEQQEAGALKQLPQPRPVQARELLGDLPEVDVLGVQSASSGIRRRRRFEQLVHVHV
jgi:hypothetical protein